ncbi:MAG TPA: hypothetical protein VLD36_13075 [Burkholderiales bacterium]|nr:hypothetical protein [Burkholderiales bacterium]
MSGTPAGFGLAIRLPLLALGMVALFAGVAGGLARLGGHALLPGATAAWHGSLMIGAFFGTVISLERAVALGARWAYAAPLAAGLGGVTLVALDAPRLAQALLLAASLLLTAASIRLAARNVALFTVTLALAAVCWAVGNIAWLAGAGLPALVPWWIAFLVLTIAGERLELTRLKRPSRARQVAFGSIVAVLVAGCAIALVAAEPGWRVVGAALVALTAWLLVQDIARRTARDPGLTGYIGRCLLAGYVWLGVGGLLLIGPGAAYATFAWDAAAHAILLGFVFSMVFGHAPVIVPAVARANVRYHWSFYVPLALLHLSVAERVVGDLAANPSVRAAGGTLSALALAVFIAILLTAIVRGRA